MAGIFQDVLKGFLGSDYLKDYRHANKTFTSAGYANSPRLKYLFHVYFNINTGINGIPGLERLFGARDRGRISVLTKAIELPKYSIDTEVMNQYNRKRNIQQKINYEPIVCDFHDDSSDITRSLWYAYYDYYYKDPSQPYDGNPSTRNTTNGSAGQPIQTLGGVDINGNRRRETIGNQGDQNARDIYSKNRIGNDWGYIAEGVGGNPGKPPFFKDITIYGFNQKSFVSYQLVNPMIQDFQHDRYDYSEGAGIMGNSMTLRYESVKYGQGAIGSDGVPGFASPEYYDKTPSSLSRPGSTNTFLGQGGVLDAGVGVFEDLSQGKIFDAAQKAGRLILNKDNISLKGVKEEVIQETRRVVAQGIATNAINQAASYIPSPKKTSSGQLSSSGGITKDVVQNSINQTGGSRIEVSADNRKDPIIEVNGN